MTLADFSALTMAVLCLLTVAMMLAFARLIYGPSLADRVVALDLIASLSIGVISVYAVATDDPVFLRVAITLALISFLGTVAFAHYIEQGGKP